MYSRWLDRWDERRAGRKDDVKLTSEFSVGADLAFPKTLEPVDVGGFCELAEQALVDPMFFDAPPSFDTSGGCKGDWVRFPSDITTEIEENNVVGVKLTASGSSEHALVIFHHWNANKWNNQIAKYFSRRGITVAEIALPYHFQRSRRGSSYADYMLSPNLGRTLQSMRQAVFDGRKLVRILKSEGYNQISVLGMSLGSWVAGLVAAHDMNVKKAALFLTAGSLADMVWTGRATKAIRESLETSIELSDLRRAWSPLDLGNHADKLARQDLDLQIVLAKRDKVVLPELSHTLLQQLQSAGANLNVLELNCGHYSLALPPHIIRAGLSLQRLINRLN